METDRKKREFNGSVQAVSCRDRPVVIGLDYISNSPSLAKINQQYYCGRGGNYPEMSLFAVSRAL